MLLNNLIDTLRKRRFPRATHGGAWRRESEMARAAINAIRGLDGDARGFAQPIPAVFSNSDD
jgi:hypothetical protein